VWAGDKDEQSSDFLAVVDVRPGSRTYGDVLTTVPVGMGGTLPHHLEYSLPAAGQTLFANGHHHEQIFRFDISDAEHPKLVGTVPKAGPLRYPHDFVRLADNSLLVGYLRSDGPSPTPIDRFVVTSAPMMEDKSADVIQIWRLSDLTLLKTLPGASGPTSRWTNARDGIIVSVRASRYDRWLSVAQYVRLWLLPRHRRCQRA
jgi:hypothetical protein